MVKFGTGIVRARAAFFGVAVSAACALAGVSGPALAADLDYPPGYGSMKDDYGDDEPRWRSRREARRDCVPRDYVRDELRAEGWRDFQHADARGDIVVVEARRARSGRPFELTIDRCSGDVIAARPLAPARRAYLRPFNDDWRGHRGRGWRERADWRDRADWRHERWSGRGYRTY